MLRTPALLDHPMERVVLRSRIMRPWRTHRFHRFGPGSIIDRPAFLQGENQMSVGSDVVILRGSSISVEGYARHKQEPVLSIGDRVGMRPFCVISVSDSVTIESDVIMGSFTCVIDSEHTYENGNPNVMHNIVRTRPVHIGRGTWLAERVAVLPGVTIGRCCIVGANSVVREDLPDLSIAAGVPARIIGEVEGVEPDRPPPADRMW
jgi:acetyltransferase-like isoleucine patch superfamily enzyme